MKTRINPNSTRKKQRRFHQPKPDPTAEVVRCMMCERSRVQMVHAKAGHICVECRGRVTPMRELEEAVAG